MPRTLVGQDGVGRNNRTVRGPRDRRRGVGRRPGGGDRQRHLGVFDEHLVEDRVVRPDGEHWKPDREDEELHDLVLWVDDSSTAVYFVPSYT